MSCDRFRYFLKVASYIPQDDMYAAGSVDRRRDEIYNNAVSKKNLGTAGAGLLAAGVTHRLSKPFADNTISLGKQRFRSAAMLGAGLYAAKRARDYFNKKQGPHGGSDG